MIIIIKVTISNIWDFYNLKTAMLLLPSSKIYMVKIILEATITVSLKTSKTSWTSRSKIQNKKKRIINQKGKG